MRLELGDWRETLPGTYDPARAVVITDPPFGLADGVDRGFADDVPWRQHVSELLELLPAVRHVIRGPAVNLLRRDYPQPRRLCVEVTAYRRRDRYRPHTVPAMWHGWAVYGRLRVGNATPRGDALHVDPMADRGLSPPPTSRPKHRGITPLTAALWIVGDWADPGMLVVDPFAGVGTIGRAAAMLGRDYLGSELEARWHAEAREQLAHEQQALAL